MADDGENNLLLVEPKIAQQVANFALDIGTSLAKVVYRSKKDYKDGKPIFTKGDKNVGRLRLALLPQTDPAALIQFIKDNVDRPEVTSTPSSVPATGCGSSIHKQLLEKALNIQLEQVVETQGVPAGLSFLMKNESQQSICLDLSGEGVADGMKQLQMFMMLAETVTAQKDGAGKGKQAEATVGSVPPQSGHSSTKPGGSDKPTDNASPCLLAVAGSANGWMLIGGPDAVRFVDMNATAGCTFVGLGRLLTRSSKTFLELIELAKQGDPSKVDIVSKDLKAATNNVDAYSALDKINDVTIGHFGKVMFNPEVNAKDADLMASLLGSMCKEFVLLTHLMAQANGVERVYLGGSFINNDHVRRIISRDIIVSKAVHRGQISPDIRLLRHCCFLGAIGAMMLDMTKRTK